MRSCTLDLETTSLDAVAGGMIVCAVVKPVGKRPETFRYDYFGDRPGKERRLVEALLDYLRDYHMLIGHNLVGFDWGMLKSRALILGVPLHYSPLAYDTMLAWRRTGLRTVLTRVGKPTASLDMIADFLGVPQMKTKLYPREHWKTVWETGRDREVAIDNLVSHCVSDTIMTEAIYWKLLDIDSFDRLKRLK